MGVLSSSELSSELSSSSSLLLSFLETLAVGFAAQEGVGLETRKSKLVKQNLKWKEWTRKLHT
jgi:hypothetical protein